CQAHSTFVERASACQPSCTEPNADENCDQPDQEACVCDKGFIMSGVECVPVEECGCMFMGQYY
ncbi:hypothetical protein CAPTEDRAFT_77904, partial [Capitella teleta]